MNTTDQKETYAVDAAGKKLGRLATDIAVHLMGKHRPDFKRHKVAPVEVVVSNASKMNISDTKLDTKEYVRYSGHPGGQRTRTAREVADQKGYGELIRRAVRGMLPKNKLQDRTMKNLTIEE